MSCIWREVLAPLAGALYGSGSRLCWHPSVKRPRERQWLHESGAYEVLDVRSLFPTASTESSVRLPLGTINYAWLRQRPRLITPKHIPRNSNIYLLKFAPPTNGGKGRYFIKGLTCVRQLLTGPGSNMRSQFSAECPFPLLCSKGFHGTLFKDNQAQPTCDIKKSYIWCILHLRVTSLDFLIEIKKLRFLLNDMMNSSFHVDTHLVSRLNLLLEKLWNITQLWKRISMFTGLEDRHRIQPRDPKANNHLL